MTGFRRLTRHREDSRWQWQGNWLNIHASAGGCPHAASEKETFVQKGNTPHKTGPSEGKHGTARRTGGKHLPEGPILCESVRSGKKNYGENEAEVKVMIFYDALFERSPSVLHRHTYYASVTMVNETTQAR